jgi:deferrochelatase/peroxidase EfeB
MGFKDGTNNLNAHDNTMMREHVWVASADQPEWMHNGTYVVVRRIHVHLTNWDTSAISDQELTIGRSKLEGAPIGRTHEHDPVDLSIITTRAHIHAAAPSLNGGVRLLRRGYNFADGVDARTGEVDAGLFFIAYQRDPRKQFIPLQRRLDHADALNEYIVHVAGAAFAVPPGVASGGFVGETLF